MSIFDQVRQAQEKRAGDIATAWVNLVFALASLTCAIAALANHDLVYAVVAVAFAVLI